MITVLRVVLGIYITAFFCLFVYYGIRWTIEEKKLNRKDKGRK